MGASVIIRIVAGALAVLAVSVIAFRRNKKTT